MKFDMKPFIFMLVSFLVLSSFSICLIRLFQARAQGPMGSLTGIIHDVGVDVDGDGAFDILTIAVEINVSDVGEFEVEVWGLLENSSYISVSARNSEHLDVGVQLVNVSLYGPTIYASGLNPTTVDDITLYSLERVSPFQIVRNYLDWADDVPLSTVYLYTDFDSPFTGMQASFAVNPDGQVEMGATVNYTDMEEPNQFVPMHGAVSFEKNDSTTEIMANLAFIIPAEEAAEFPFNSSTVEMQLGYSDETFTVSVNGSTVFPPAIASTLPFNVSDFTVKAEYAGNMIEGNVTFYMWNGLPVDDIMVDFQGNNTYIHLNGSASVIFGNYSYFGELNTTVLQYLLANLTDTFGGQGPGSLYNMTNGLLEFTMLENATTPHNGNATVDFEAKIEGDVIEALANMTGQPPPFYDVLNGVCTSIGSGSLLLTYSHALGAADMNLVIAANVTQLVDNMISLLPDLAPPQEAAFIESILNTTYCTVDTAQVTLHYMNGQATLNVTASVQNLNAEVSYLKNLFLTFNFPQPLTPQLQTVNLTQIDLTGFNMQFNLAETMLEASVGGVTVKPPLDWINATNFKLETFFNITSAEYEFPGAGEQLSVTVEGGSNATHTLTIIQPGTVPTPDSSAPGGMMWNNQSISGLKHLVFNIGPLDDTPPIISTPVQTPITPDDGETVTVRLNVTDAYTGVRADLVTLSYSVDSGTWNNVTLTKTAGDTFEGQIPGLTAGTQVEYMITAFDYANNEAVENNAGAYYVYVVIPEFPTLQTILVTLLLLGVVLVVLKKTARDHWKLLSDL